MTIKEQISIELKPILKELAGQDIDPNISFNEDSTHGDYSTNVALVTANKIGKNPVELGEEIKQQLTINNSYLTLFGKVEVVKPGFINFWINNSYLISNLDTLINNKRHIDIEKDIVLEFSDPNPFKELHAGHLYTSIVGDAIGRLLTYQGARVHNVNYGGDVGLHAGKTMWAILQKLGGENPEKLNDIPEKDRSKFMAECYVAGTNAYEDDANAKGEIIALNKKIYALHSQNDHESPLGKIYWTCRAWSYDYFDEFYKKVGTTFEKYYPESEIAELGLRTVKEQLAKGVFKESEGAIVFEGEPYGLHTRVFINSQGLPTYEAKDVGLIQKKWEDYKFDKSVIITGNEQAQYMQVVLKSLEQFEPELAQKTKHLTHGLVKLKDSGKMSSRAGNILRADDILNTVSDTVEKIRGKTDWDVALGAIKYAFLKQGIGADIIFDIDESVSIEGNSGPYIQYAYVRTQSVLAKAGMEDLGSKIKDLRLEFEERELLRLLNRFEDVVQEAADRFAPNTVCTYLFELAQAFNLFYQKCPIIKSEGEVRELRLSLTAKTGEIIKKGLDLLGIKAPSKM